MQSGKEAQIIQRQNDHSTGKENRDILEYLRGIACNINC